MKSFLTSPSETVSKVLVQPLHTFAKFRSSDTDLEFTLEKMTTFVHTFYGMKKFIPKSLWSPFILPWMHVLPIFDPGHLSVKEIFERLILSQGILVSRTEFDLDQFTGIMPTGKPRFQIIDNSLAPSADTLGDSAKSADHLRDDKRPYLDLRGYLFAFAFRYYLQKDYLDNDTWTIFPSNRVGEWVCTADWEDRKPMGEGLRVETLGPTDKYKTVGARLVLDVTEPDES